MGSVANSMRLISFHNTLTYLPVVSAITLVSKAYVARKYSHIKPDQREEAIKDPSELHLYRMSWVDCVFRIIPIANLVIFAKNFYESYQIKRLLEKAHVVNLAEQAKRGLLEQAAALGSAIAERELALDFYQKDKKTQVHKMRIATTAWDAVAFRHLGEHHFLLQNRDGITKEEKEEEKEKGLEFYRLAAGQGDAISQDFLGQYYSSIGDLEQSKRFYSLALKQHEKRNTPENTYMLGRYHFHGIPDVLKKDLGMALTCYRDAAAKGHEFARKQLGKFYRFGLEDEQSKTIVEKDLTKALEIYQEDAARGRAWAQYTLGTLYETNQIHEKEVKEADENFRLQEAVRLYKAAADQGHAKGQCRLGYLYENGKGIEQSYDKAVEFYKLAEDRCLYGKYALGKLYERGRGVPKDLAQAITLYQAVAKDVPLAGYALGRLYEKGEGVFQNPVKASQYYNLAVPQLQFLARYGFAETLLALAGCYLFGRKVTADRDEALRYLDLAVRQGDPEAEYMLGTLYEEGCTVRAPTGDQQLLKDTYKAYDLYYSAGFIKGHVDALYVLGEFFESGIIFGNPNYTAATQCYKRAAEKGHAGAQCALGRLYSVDGAEGMLDPEESIRWYSLAVAQGNADAQYALGIHYQFREEPDMKEAIHYYELAANQNHGEAELQLGRCYEQGVGVPASSGNAFAYYRYATIHGCVQGLDALYALAQARELVATRDAWLEAWRIYRKAEELGHPAAREEARRLAAAIHERDGVHPQLIEE